MIFSTKSRVPQNTPRTIKRQRTDSELVMPHSKRTKRALSDGDNADTCLSSVSSSGQDNGSEQSSEIQEMSNIWRSYRSRKLPSASPSSGSTAGPSDDAALNLHLGTTEEDAVMKDYLSNERHHAAACHFKKILAIEYLHLQTRIIEQLVTQDRSITPYYKQGTLRAYIVSDYDGQPDAFSDEELALAMVMGDSHRHLTTPFVNRALEKVYRSLFYSRNNFAFDDPRAALWFFKSIGGNIKIIRSVTLTMDGGLERYRRNDAIGESIEELWYGVLCWLQYRHELGDLTIVFREMPTRSELNRDVKACDDHMIDDAMMFRKKIAQKLNTFRGITRVRLLDPRNVYMIEDELRDLQLAMQQPKEEQESIVDKRKTSLLDTLNSSRTRNDLAASTTTDSEEFEDLFDYNRVEDQPVESSQDSTSPSGVINMQEADSTTGVEIFDADTNTFAEVDTMIHDYAEASEHSTPTPPIASSTLSTLSRKQIRLLKRKEKRLRQMKEKDSKDITPKVLAPVIMNSVANDSEAPLKYEAVPPRHVRERLPPTEPIVLPGMSSVIPKPKPTASEHASHTAEPAASETFTLETRMSELLQPTTFADVIRSAGHSKTIHQALSLKSEISPQNFYGNPISNPNTLYSSQTLHGLAAVTGTKSSISSTDTNASTSMHSTGSAQGGTRNRQQGHYGKKKHDLAKYDI